MNLRLWGLSALLTLPLLAASGATSSAQADDWQIGVGSNGDFYLSYSDYDRKGYKYGPRKRYRGYDGRHDRRYRKRHRRNHYSGGYGKRYSRACHPVSKSGYWNGYKAKIGGTMCYDSYGNGYVVKGSRHLIHYY